MILRIVDYADRGEESLYTIDDVILSKYLLQMFPDEVYDPAVKMGEGLLECIYFVMEPTEDDNYDMTLYLC